MTLYEITNGMIGESYVRCYAWSENKDVALDLALTRFQARWPETKREALKIKELLNKDTFPFVTNISDEGWEV